MGMFLTPRLPTSMAADLLLPWNTLAHSKNERDDLAHGSSRTAGNGIQLHERNLS